MSWNHRIVTQIVNKIRLFDIAEVYYDSEGVPHSYCSVGTCLTGWADLQDLKGTYDKIASAFEKPIINLDNFPNEFKND